MTFKALFLILLQLLLNLEYSTPVFNLFQVLHLKPGLGMPFYSLVSFVFSTILMKLNVVFLMHSLFQIRYYLEIAALYLVLFSNMMKIIVICQKSVLFYIYYITE